VNTRWRVFWGALVVAGLVAEIIAVLHGEKGDTLSEFVWEGIDRHPWLALVIAVVLGHWIWPRVKKEK
jgi:hypothetical protein